MEYMEDDDHLDNYDDDDEEEEDDDIPPEDDPFPAFHLNLDRLTEEEAMRRFSLIFDEKSGEMRKRENDDYLRPIFIDGIDISNRINHIIRKNMDLFPVDRAVFNMRAISNTIWHFLIRGHLAVVYLPTNLREFAQKCSDPHELSILVKLELVVFDGSTVWNPGSTILLSKTIAIAADKNDGCIVGSRKKYGLLAQKYPELTDRVTNYIVRPSFDGDHKLSIAEGVPLSIKRHEVRRYSDQENGIDYQLLMTDQVPLMGEMATLMRKDCMFNMYTQAREMSRSIHGPAWLRNRDRPSSSRIWSAPYQYNDPYLPEYVAPPPPCVLEALAKSTRIGHKHSIYRFGEQKKNKKETISPFRVALIEALTPMFGKEKANELVRENPEIEEINELIEIGISQ